jgi:thymidylate synthase
MTCRVGKTTEELCGCSVAKNNDELYNSVLKSIEAQPMLGNGTQEILNFYAPFDPLQQLSRAKQGYVDAELHWYKSMERNIKNYPKIGDNPIWQRCATEDGNVNSNYGWCVFSPENGNQYNKAVQALLKDSWSRQSTCIYIRPEMHDICQDGIHARYDFICTFCTHHFIRDNKLEYIVYMRSNDIEFGLPYDLAWHQYLYKNMLNDIIVAGDYSDNSVFKNLGVGKIHWHASTLHKYEKISKAGASLA